MKELKTYFSEKTILKIKDFVFDYSLNLGAAILIGVIGWWLIKIINRLVQKYFERSSYDETLERFAADIINWALKILLFTMIVTQLGVKSSSLIAALGAASLAIGLALQGSLSNFAGGVLILAFKPFKIGDFIEAQGVMGTVKEISIFTTKLNTPGNQLAILPNSQVSNSLIKNYSAEPIRKNMLTVNVAYDSDLKLAKTILLDLLLEQDGVLKDPAPEVVVANLGPSSVDLSMRFWAKNEDYWAVNFYTVEELKERLDTHNIKIPFPQREITVINS